MTDLAPPIIYLESTDFDNNGNLKKKLNLPAVVMIQANYCGHCTQAKPAFQSFADESNKKVLCFAIEADVKQDSWKKLLNLIKPSFQGFPDYLYVGNKSKNIKGRSVDNLKDFAFKK
jgi:thiol-disulfide isomerase/thioredoxin